MCVAILYNRLNRKIAPNVSFIFNQKNSDSVKKMIGVTLTLSNDMNSKTNLIKFVNFNQNIHFTSRITLYQSDSIAEINGKR
jgi:hypothetical protein